MTAVLTVKTNAGAVSETFSRAVSGITRYDRSRTADGRRVSLWTGEGMAARGMAAHWYKSRAAMFRTQGRSTGTPWIDYTQEESQYAAIKGSIFGRRVGRDRGDLLRWLPGNERLVPSFVRPRHPHGQYRAGRTTLTIGSRLSYARNHELGRGRAPKILGGHRIPQRRVLGLGRALIADWDKDVLEFTRAHTAAIGRQMSRASILELI